MTTLPDTSTPNIKLPELPREDQTLLLFAGLMEGGKEDDEMCQDLDRLTKLLKKDVEMTEAGSGKSICVLIDSDCVDTLLGYLDMRQPEAVRAHATMTTTAYLEAAGEDGGKQLTAFFEDRVNRGTYDDYIVAFCVAATVFPMVPDLTAGLFLAEGFLSSLGPLMRRKWKSRKVETACLDLLNVACMNAACSEAVQKYCTDWLEEIVDQDLDDVVKDMYTANQDAGGGSISMRRHSRQVQNRAAVILAKLKATLSPQRDVRSATMEASDMEGSGIGLATTSIENLSKFFMRLLVNSQDDQGQDRQNSVEGLAYASLQPAVKDLLMVDSNFLWKLVQTLREAPPRSPLTYGALSILANLTRYQPVQTEEQRRLSQLKAYTNAVANAGGVLQEQEQELNDDEHVTARCQRVFEAGVVPVLVSYRKSGSTASLQLSVGILHALSVVSRLRGPLAQQGAIRLLIDAWNRLPATEVGGRQLAAQALARILISTNPALVFGGTRAMPMSASIRPLVSLLKRDEKVNVNTVDLLPTFEALMALTNLASTDDDMRRGIIRAAWAIVEELILSSNARVTRAAVELVCNLVEGPEGVALYADTTSAAHNRLRILVALVDAEDAATRSAAGGALAGLTTYEGAVRGVLAHERGVRLLLGMCAASETDDSRHRGAVTLYNMAMFPGEVGVRARAAIQVENGVALLTEAAKASRRPEVIEAVVLALQALVGGGR